MRELNEKKKNGGPRGIYDVEEGRREGKKLKARIAIPQF